MSWKIYSYPNNPRVWKVLIAAEYAGIKIETPPFKIGTDNKTPEFLQKNPVGKVPVLECPDGYIWESNAIARYVARQGKSKLYGNSLYEDALIDQWMDYAVNEIELPSAAWLFPILNIVPYHKEATDKAKADISQAMGVLNTHLSTRTFLVGERISLADIVVSMVLYRLYKMVFDPTFRKPYINLTRWYETVVNQKEFKTVIGEVELCTKMMVATPSATTTTAAPAPAQPAQKPAEKPKAAEGEEDEEAPKKKGKNPLDSLPKSSFDIEEWKRVYSNASDTRKDALPWLWKNFDKEGYSFWFFDYKYNEDFEELFKTCNFIGGFEQRFDPLRKYAFANMLIFGDSAAKKFQVSGVFLWRGLDVPQEMKDHDQFDQFAVRKLDIENPADKALIEDYFAWNGDFGGRKFLDNGKILK